MLKKAIAFAFVSSARKTHVHQSSPPLPSYQYGMQGMHSLRIRATPTSEEDDLLLRGDAGAFDKEEIESELGWSDVTSEDNAAVIQSFLNSFGEKPGMRTCRRKLKIILNGPQRHPKASTQKSVRVGVLAVLICGTAGP